MIARFIREGEALRQLNHPSIVTLLDAVQENGHYYLVMELVEGGALDEKLRRTPQMDVQEVLNIALDLADALARAHRLNIVHRDIKPANVLLAKDGMPRLTDFGIARVVGSQITEAGSIIGTTAYISPEVLQGDPADARSDIWSLGIMLYEMLAGEQPFKASNPGSLIFAILTEPTLDLEPVAQGAEYDEPYAFGQRITVDRPGPFRLREYVRLQLLRTRIQANPSDLDAPARRPQARSLSRR